MKCLLILVSLCALAGCDRTAENVKAKFTGTGDIKALTRYVDAEWGVTCYETTHEASVAMSCVQVQEGTKASLNKSSPSY